MGVYGRATESVGVLGLTQNAASYAGYFSGDVFSTGMYLGSDRMLKQDERSINDALSLINGLQPKSYTYRTAQFRDMNLPSGKRYGLVAQEVEEVLPQLIKETTMVLYDWDKFDKDTELAEENETRAPSQPEVLETMKFKAVNYTEFIPILLAGMQEQQANFQNLAENNVALQSEVGNLKQANTDLKTELQALKQAVQQLQQNNQ